MHDMLSEGEAIETGNESHWQLTISKVVYLNTFINCHSYKNKELMPLDLTV